MAMTPQGPLSASDQNHDDPNAANGWGRSGSIPWSRPTLAANSTEALQQHGSAFR